MQQTQEMDLKAMENLYSFFESFISVNHIAAIGEKKADENAILPQTMTSPEVMTLQKARDILINQINQRIHYREDLMGTLQEKLNAIKEKKTLIEQQAQAIFHSSTFRMNYPRGI